MSDSEHEATAMAAIGVPSGVDDPTTMTAIGIPSNTCPPRAHTVGPEQVQDDAGLPPMLESTLAWWNVFKSSWDKPTWWL